MTRRLLLAAFLPWMLAACGPSLEVTVAGPEGALERRPHSVRFQLSGPLYDAARPLVTPIVPEVRVEPPVPFRVQVSSPTSVDVDFVESLALAKEYRVTLKAGLRAESGARLKKDRVVAFTTPLNGLSMVGVAGEVPVLVRAGKAMRTLPRLGPADGLVLQLVAPLREGQQGLFHLVTQDGRQVPVDAAVDAESPGRVLLKPQGPLPRDASLMLVIDAGLKVGGEGAGELATTEPVHVPLRSWGRLEWALPAPGQCEPPRALAIAFTNPVDCEKSLARLSVDVEGTRLRCISKSVSRLQRYELTPTPPSDRVVKLTLAAGLEDAFAEVSPAPLTLEFRACSADVQFAHTRPFVILDAGQSAEALERVQGAEALKVEGRRLPAAQLLKVLKGQGLSDQLAWTELPWWIVYQDEWFGMGDGGEGGAEAEPQRRPGELTGEPLPELDGAKTITVPLPKSEGFRDVSVPLEPILGGPRGVALLRETPVDALGRAVARPVLRVANVTDIGLSARLSRDTLLVMAVRYSDAKPMAGVELQVMDEEGRLLAKGATDGEGLMSLPMPPLTSEGLSDLRLLIVASDGNDEAFLWSRFVVDALESMDRPELLGMVYSDRGIYRPGESGHLHGVFRYGSKQGLSTLAGQAGQLTVSGPDGESILSETVTLTGHGSFDKAFEVPKSARVGEWSATVRFGDQSQRHTFQVGEFRRAELKVEVQAPSSIAWGEELRAVVQGDYLFGAPAAGQPVTWSLMRADAPYRSQRHPQAVFSTPGQYEWMDDSDVRLVEEATGKLDQNGAYAVARPMRLPEPVAQHERLLLSASVEDASGQSVARMTTVDLYSAGLVAGVMGGGYVLKAKSPATLEAVTLSPDDTPISADVVVTTRTSGWRSVRRSGPGGGSYWSSERVETGPVERCRGRTDTAGRLKCTFTPEDEGSLLVTVEAKGKNGRVARGGAWRWVYGDAGSWGGDGDAPKVELFFDSDSVDAGETARVVLNSPFPAGHVLLTVEREEILWKKSFSMGRSTLVELPTELAWAPNVHVVATVVSGRQPKGTPPDADAERPRYALGRKLLKVRPKQNRLDVGLSVASARVEPGQQQTARVVVKRADGSPSRAAEVNLWAVDEGTLMLTGYKTPDLLAAMFRNRGSRTLGLDTRAYVLGKRTFIEPVKKGEEDGGGGGEESELRKNFNPLAVWVGSAVTDAEGRVERAFNVPDNLTTYRVMAVVAEEGDRFGSGEGSFRVNKALMLRQAMSRFVRPGDRLQAGVLVNQLTEGPGTATVTLESLDEKLFEVSGSRKFEVAVKPGETVPVRFDLTARDAVGSAKMIFSAQMGAHRDRVELELPVLRLSPRESVAASGVVTSGAFETTLSLPEQARAESLELNVSAFPVSALEGRLRDMVEYPYGCLEQRTSRILPLLAIGGLAKQLEMKSIPTDQIKGWVEEYLTLIPRYRCSNDGFDYWPGCKFGASTILSAFALEGMLTARQFGYAVDQQEIDRTIGFLQTMVRTGSQGRDQYGGDGLVDHEFVGALRVLSAAGQPETALEQARFEKRASLPLFAKTDLVRAMAGHLGKKVSTDPSVRVLMDEIGAAGKMKDGALTYDAAPDDRYWSAWESPQRNTALVLRTLVEVAPADGRIPLLIKGLVNLDRASPYYVTADTTQTLLGLAGAMNSIKPEGTKARIAAAGKEFGEQTLGPKVSSWSVPGAALSGSIPLSITGTGTGPVYFGAYLNYGFPATARLPASSHGFTLVREYLGESGAPLPLEASPNGPVLTLRVGDLVRVRIKAKVSDEGRLALIEDPLPAGLEAVNADLATSDQNALSRMGQKKRMWWDDAPRELRDDRVEWHFAQVWEGELTLDYVAKATTAGTYYAPGAHAERMYQPHVNGRSEGLTVKVLPKAN